MSFMAKTPKSLYIANQKTCQLIRELAALKGVSLTEAVNIATRNALEEEHAKAKVASTANSP